MIIDIHSHILPGLDDGARDMDETVGMLEIAVREGIEAIVTTPHYEVGVERERLAKYGKVYEDLQNYITTHEIPLKLYPGNEIYYSESIPEMLQNEVVRTLNGTRYVLVEFPMHAGYQTIERALNNLLYAGYWPVIAHMERYSVLRDLQKIRDLVRNGAYIQVNASAIVGKEGWGVKRFCRQLMKADLVHVVATDAHGISKRRPTIRKCLDYIEKKHGRTYRKQISEDNPLRILKGEKIGGKN